MKKILLLAAVAASLGATPLTFLLGGGTLTDGTRTYSNFSFVRTCSGAGVCAPLDASGIDITVDSGGYLTMSAGFAASSFANFSSADFLVAWDVSGGVTNTIGLMFNGAVSGDISFAQVVETILVPGPFVAGQIQVDAPGGPFQAGLDFTGIGGLTQFRVVKDILLVGGSTSGGLGYASISFVDQMYGGASDVPEPASLAIVGSGLVALSFLRRRARQ